MSEEPSRTESPLSELSFTVSARIARPLAEVYDAVAEPEQLSRYFTTGGARGQLTTGQEVTWEFADFPGPFPVTVIEADPPHRIVIEWDGDATLDASQTTRVTFEFEAIDDGSRTLITITEHGWTPSAQGARNAFGNCEGWSMMLAALKVWIEHGITLREGYYR